MARANDNNRVAAALNYLREHRQFFEFDDQERVVKVGVSDVANPDEIAVHIGNLRDLQELTFYRTGLTDCALSHLANLVSLKRLSIDGSGFTSCGLAHLGGMTQLEYLYIGDARGLDRAGLACIARVPSVRELALRGGRFCDADLESLSTLVNLEELRLSENDEIHGTFCKYLIGFSQLRHLSIGELGGQVTDEGLASIAELLSLNKLYLTGPFTNTGLRHLFALQNLTTLAIDSENVTAEGIAVVAELPKLDCLHLDVPRLTDDGIAALLRCSALEEMTLTRSALSDCGLQQLRDSLPKCGVHDIERDQCQPQPEDDANAARPKLDSSTPFETLLAKASDFDLVNGTFVKIGARYHHWVDASQYTPEERVIMLVWHSAGIIGNGGFEYLFAGEFPGDLDFHITAEAYRIAGIDRSYEAFQTAFSLFPNGIVPRDPQERSRLYEMANKSVREGLNRKVWHDDRVLSKKLAECIRANAPHLGNLDAAP
jgi:hypothetical protein